MLHIVFSCFSLLHSACFTLHHLQWGDINTEPQHKLLAAHQRDYRILLYLLLQMKFARKLSFINHQQP